MTRDEAIAKAVTIVEPSMLRPDPDRAAEIASCEVDILAALGILKLDEPKSATEKFKDALIDQGWSPQGVDDAIRQAGVKIVEK